jgi:hypothetical protein
LPQSLADHSKLSIFAFYPLSEVLERLDPQFRRVPEHGNIGSSDNVNGREKTTAWEKSWKEPKATSIWIGGEAGADYLNH